MPGPHPPAAPWASRLPFRPLKVSGRALPSWRTTADPVTRPQVQKKDNRSQWSGARCFYSQPRAPQGVSERAGAPPSGDPGRGRPRAQGDATALIWVASRKQSHAGRSVVTWTLAQKTSYRDGSGSATARPGGVGTPGRDLWDSQGAGLPASADPTPWKEGCAC